MLYSLESTSVEYEYQLVESIKDVMDLNSISKVKDITGGVINKAALYETNKGKLFVKYADRNNALDMFESEAWSLARIRGTDVIKVPDSIQVHSHPMGGAYHVMEYIEDLKVPVKTCWKELGENFAQLHKVNHDRVYRANRMQQSVHGGDVCDVGDAENHQEPVYKFGSYRATHLGPNFTIPAGTWCDTSGELQNRFYFAPLFAQIDEQYNDQELRELWSALQLKIDKLDPDDDLPPSITHGDFCEINVGESQGKPVIFDPSTSYDHWEGDFTIITLEKNFPVEFYTGYHDVIPEPEGFHNRMKLQHLFCHLLYYSVEGSNRDDALAVGKEVLELAK